jgi:hypothetical protein
MVEQVKLEELAEVAGELVVLVELAELSAVNLLLHAQAIVNVVITIAR